MRVKWNVQVLVWSMCEWYNCNVQMEKCASASLVNVGVIWFCNTRMSSGLVFTTPKCASAQC